MCRPGGAQQMGTWQIGAFANALVAVVYVAIALIIAAPLKREGQLGANRLGTATAAIFFTCAIGHAMHALHLIGPAFGVEQSEGIPLRDSYSWHHAIWDL